MINSNVFVLPITNMSKHGNPAVGVSKMKLILYIPYFRISPFRVSVKNKIALFSS